MRIEMLANILWHLFNFISIKRFQFSKIAAQDIESLQIIFFFSFVIDGEKMKKLLIDIAGCLYLHFRYLEFATV